MDVSAKILDLKTVPVTVLWIFAVTGFLVLFGTVLWILPPGLRRGPLLRALPLALLLFVHPALTRDPRSDLFFEGSFGLSCLVLLTMGRMPADMPSARDPAIRLHPAYPKVRRRGVIAGVTWATLFVALIVLAGIFVR